MFKDIFRNTLAYAASRMIERVSTVVLSVFVARQLGASGLGVYSAAMVYFALISSAADMGAPNYLIREISNRRELTSRYLVHLAVMTLALCGVVAGLSWIVVPHLGYSPELEESMYLVVLAILPGILRSMQEGAFVAHQRVEFVTYSTTIAAAVYVCTALFLINRGSGVVSLIVAFVLMQYCLCACYCAFLHRYVSPFRLEFSLRFAAQLIGEIKVFAGSSMLAGLAGRPEILILSLFKNDAQIGFYSAALRISEAWTLVPDTYMTNVYAVLSKSHHLADRGRFQFIVQKSITYLFALALPLTAGIVVGARPILTFVYGPAFDRAVPVLRILAWCIPLAALHAVLWRVLAARNQQHLMLRAQVLTTGARLAAGCGLIAWLPVVGAAASTSFGMLAHNLMLAKYVRSDGMRLALFRLNWRVCSAAAVMGVAVWLALGTFPLWVVVACAAGLYAGLVLLFRGLSREDLSLFRKAPQPDATNC